MFVHYLPDSQITWTVGMAFTTFPSPPSVILLDLFHIRLYHWCRHHIAVHWHRHGLSDHTFRILLWGSSLRVRILEVFSHLRCRNLAVLAMFSCFSDTSLSLPSEMITAAFQPCPPTPSEYSRPYSPLHFQSRCVGAHTRSLSSAEHLQNGSLLIYKDFANLLHDTKRLTICFIQYTRMHREWLKTP